MNRGVVNFYIKEHRKMKTILVVFGILWLISLFGLSRWKDHHAKVHSFYDGEAKMVSDLEFEYSKDKGHTFVIGDYHYMVIEPGEKVLVRKVRPEDVGK
jgi:hypothetical protein